ncbi:cyclophilin-like fold protein [Pseudomonas fulva]|nr:MULTISPECIES: cyclophilin-like fold protein [Pseudomonas]MCP6690305.1 cyclophilin-like fold protein [Pseudomonas donghuensis]MCY4126246.1 cyclophilin-like fold protein [Pseudomonas sp.]WKU98093.1 cyclophilin-like fold protein [Pseudomonas fulva]
MLSGYVIAAPKPKEKLMWMTIGDKRFAITLDDNESARALAQLLPLTLDMTELNANEKYATLPQRLPTRAARPGTIRNGDLMLYGNDTLVIFYQTFESIYAYSHLGRVDSPDQLIETLGKGNVSVHFSMD